MWNKIAPLALLIATVSTTPSFAVETVRVGLAHFPPFVIYEMKKGISGIAVEMIDVMNKFQSKYRFEKIATSPMRKIRDFENGRYDISMFDNIDWGWRGLPVDVSEVFLKGGEIYIALKEPKRGQEFFSDFENKRMIGVLGYHYGFAGFNSNTAYLRKTFNMTLTTSNLGSINMILAGNRGDIAVVTSSFINKYLLKHPKAKKRLLLSKKVDQEYDHTFILRKGIGLNIEELNRLLGDMKNAGVLRPLWRFIEGAD